MVSSSQSEKVVLLGKAYCGKTCLANRFLRSMNWCDQKYETTIGSAFGEKIVKIENSTIKLGIWDTAGAERYEAMSRMYYRGAKAAIVCYDITDNFSYERAVSWCKELKENETNCLLFLCGTKKDLVFGDRKNCRKIDFHDAREMAEELGAKFFETSSLSGEGVDELFQQVAEDLFNRKQIVDYVPSNQFTISDAATNKKSKCPSCKNS